MSVSAGKDQDPPLPNSQEDLDLLMATFNPAKEKSGDPRGYGGKLGGLKECFGIGMESSGCWEKALESGRNALGFRRELWNLGREHWEPSESAYRTQRMLLHIAW